MLIQLSLANSVSCGKKSDNHARLVTDGEWRVFGIKKSFTYKYENLS